MRLPDDDELYEVDQTYLGPPGRYIGVMRHKTIFAALAILPLEFVTARRLGVPMTLLTVGLLLIAGVWLSMTIADRTSHERPVTALLTSLWRDLTARRAPVTAPRRASGSTWTHTRAPHPRLQRAMVHTASSGAPAPEWGLEPSDEAAEQHPDRIVH